MQSHTAENLDSDVDEFIGVLSRAQLNVGPGEPISGLDWLSGSKDPLARQIRIFVLILANWPTQNAPWVILQPMLRLAMHRVTTGEQTEISQCEFKYSRSVQHGGTQCRNSAVTANHRCHLHGGK